MCAKRRVHPLNCLKMPLIVRLSCCVELGSIGAWLQVAKSAGVSGEFLESAFG